MKLLQLCLATLLILPAMAAAGEQDLWDQKLPFKSATINYTIEGMEKGTEILYIKDHGARTAKYHTGSMTMMGMTMETKTVEIINKNWVYSYNLTEGTGSKTPNPNKYMKMEYNKLTAAEKKQVRKNAEKMSVNFIQGGGGSLQENATEMFGFKVDKVTVMGFDSYQIHKTPIILKSSGNMMGMSFNITATDFKKGKVDEKHFTHPPGITAEMNEQAADMSQTMAKNTMDWLKDPDAAQKAPPMAMPGMGGGQTPPPSQQGENRSDSTQQLMEGVMKGLFGN